MRAYYKHLGISQLGGRGHNSARKHGLPIRQNVRPLHPLARLRIHGKDGSRTRRATILKRAGTDGSSARLALRARGGNAWPRQTVAGRPPNPSRAPVPID